MRYGNLLGFQRKEPPVQSVKWLLFRSILGHPRKGTDRARSDRISRCARRLKPASLPGPENLRCTRTPLFPGTPRHNPGTPNLNWSHRRHSSPGRPRMRRKHLRLLGHNLAVFPNVNRRSVHARHFSGSTGGTPHSTTDTGSKALRLLRRLTSSCHGPRSSNLGLDSEFSYIAQ